MCDGMIVIHGDELCTNDHAYQSFKQEVRQPAWIEQFLQKPLPDRQEIAVGLRQASQEAQANRAEAIGDAVSSEIELWMKPTMRPSWYTDIPTDPQCNDKKRPTRSHVGLGTHRDWDLCRHLRLQADHQPRPFIGPTGPVISEQWSRQTGTPEWKRNS